MPKFGFGLGCFPTMDGRCLATEVGKVLVDGKEFEDGAIKWFDSIDPVFVYYPFDPEKPGSYLRNEDGTLKRAGGSGKVTVIFTEEKT